MGITDQFRGFARFHRGCFVVCALLAMLPAWPAVAQVRSPEPPPRQDELIRLQAPPRVGANPVRLPSRDPQVEQAQRRLDAQRDFVESQRRHDERLRKLPVSTPPSRMAELTTQREQQAGQRRRAALQQERDALERDARARERHRMADPSR